MFRMKLTEQAETFLHQIERRKRGPARKATLLSFRNRLDSIILPRLGQVDLKDIDNRTLRVFVADISPDLAPTTVTACLSLLKAVIASAVDANGNRTFNRTWNQDFIDAPLIRKQDLKAPIMGQKALSQAILASQGQNQGLYSLLAGTGLRIGEALALGTGQGRHNIWDPDKAVLRVNATVLQNGEIQPMPKTEAGIREVDLHPELNSFLRLLLPRQGGLLFGDGSKPLVYSTLLRQMQRLGIEEGFHAFRRFRVTHLERNNVPHSLIQFWTGHAAGDITDHYTRIGSDILARKEWCEKVGLGFQLPTRKSN